MTLLEDLEASAGVADLNAEECDKADAPEAAESCRVFASRIRKHRERLLHALKQSEKSNTLVTELIYWLNDGPAEQREAEGTEASKPPRPIPGDPR